MHAYIYIYIKYIYACSSINHENDYYEMLIFINKSKFTFTDVDNENN